MADFGPRPADIGWTFGRRQPKSVSKIGRVRPKRGRLRPKTKWGPSPTQGVARTRPKFARHPPRLAEVARSRCPRLDDSGVNLAEFCPNVADISSCLARIGRNSTEVGTNLADVGPSLVDISPHQIRHYCGRARAKDARRQPRGNVSPHVLHRGSGRMIVPPPRTSRNTPWRRPRAKLGSHGAGSPAAPATDDSAWTTRPLERRFRLHSGGSLAMETIWS